VNRPKPKTALIMQMRPNGLLIEVEGKRNGFVRKRELSWDEAGMSPQDKYKTGDSIQVVPCPDADNQYSYYSIKRVEKDPWYDNYKFYEKDLKSTKGRVVRGVVENVFSDRAHILLEDKNDAVLFHSGLPDFIRDDEASPNLTSIFSVGDHIEARVDEINHQYQNLVLNINMHLESLAAQRNRKKETGKNLFIMGELVPELANLGLRISEDNEKETAKSFSDVRVLLVEDHPDDRREVCEILDDAGCEYFAPDSFSDFNDILGAKQRFDLLLLDKHLDKWEDSPTDLQIDEFIPLLKEASPKAMSVVTTIEEEETPDEIIKRLGVDYCIKKTIQKEDIEIKLKMLQDPVQSESYIEMRRMNQDVRFRREFASSVDTLNSGLDSILKTLCSQPEEGLKAAVLKMDPVTHETICVRDYPSGVIDWPGCKGGLRYTPVADVILGDAPEHYAFLPDSRKKHFPKQLVFQSFFGVPIRTYGETLHGLFLLGKTAGTITEEMLRQATDATFFMVGLLERSMIEEILIEEGLFSSMGRLYMAMGHEIRNAVDGAKEIPERLRKHIKMLLSDELKDGNRETIVNNIYNELKNMENVGKNINRTFDFYARLKRTDDANRFRIDTLIEEVNKEIKGRHGPKETFWETEADANIKVTASRIKLKQVLRNLLINSCQQMVIYDTMFPYLYIKTFADHNPERPMVRITVTDSGPGIQRRDWERIFEPFYSTRKKGTGLGLYICRLLARTMGGDVRVQSSYRFIGTTILVELPAT